MIQLDNISGGIYIIYVSATARLIMSDAGFFCCRKLALRKRFISPAYRSDGIPACGCTNNFHFRANWLPGLFAERR